jgi:hypothetical protein
VAAEMWIKVDAGEFSDVPRHTIVDARALHREISRALRSLPAWPLAYQRLPAWIRPRGVTKKTGIACVDQATWVVGGSALMVEG